METSLRNVPWGSSARDHRLASYKAALISVLLAQFDRHKGFADGMQVSFPPRFPGFSPQSPQRPLITRPGVGVDKGTRRSGNA